MTIDFVVGPVQQGVVAVAAVIVAVVVVVVVVIPSCIKNAKKEKLVTKYALLQGCWN